MEGLCGLISDEKIKICVKEKSNRCFLIKLELNLFISNQKANFIPHSALCESCNGEVDIGFWHFKEKNATFTF